VKRPRSPASGEPRTTLTDRERLRDLLRSRSLRRGEFVLSSGARSTYYIDARTTTMAGEGQLLIGRTGLDALDAAGWHPASVGGLTLGADPVAYALAHAAAVRGRRLDAFTVRKEAKGHGTGRRIEGGFQRDTEVVVVEDVVTSGDSALRAIQVIEENGARVIGVLAVVDREETGRERLERAGYPLIALFTTGALLED
jgi:orotate phosphoribosyltransferase